MPHLRIDVTHCCVERWSKFRRRSLGGLDELENLALACQRCNGYRYNFTRGIDPDSQAAVLLFNPRVDRWNDHLIWQKGGLVIRGKTAIGRATCTRLDLNDESHNDGAIVRAQSSWVKVDWHRREDW